MREDNRTDIIVDYAGDIARELQEAIDGFLDDRNAPQYTPEIMKALSEAHKQIAWVRAQAESARQP